MGMNIGGQKDVAEKLGLHPSTVCGYLKGEYNVKKMIEYEIRYK